MEAAMNRENLSEDPAIKELAEALRVLQRESAAADVIALAVYVGKLEEKLDAVQRELEAAKEQMGGIHMRPKQKPLKQYLTETESKLEDRYDVMKSQMSEIKTEVKRTAKQVVADVKRCGAKGLNKLSEFFGIKKRLENFRNNVEESMTDVKDVIDKINKVDAGFREADNAVRTFLDTPEEEEAKKEPSEKKAKTLDKLLKLSNRSVSKTSLLKKPFERKEKVLNELLTFSDKTIEMCERISQTALQERPKWRDEEEGERETTEQEMRADRQKGDFSEQLKKAAKKAQEEGNVVSFSKKKRSR